jgi:hypothetical protein
MSEYGRSLAPRSDPSGPGDTLDSKKTGSGGHLGAVRAAVAGISAAEAERVMAAVAGMREYYQYHIRRLKDLVKDKQADFDVLQAGIAGLREEASGLRLAEREQAAAAEAARHYVIEKDKEIGRLRVLLEEEKAKFFQKRRAEQDWLDDLDKLRREIVALRELGSIKEEEIGYLKKQLRSVEDEAMDLRDQKRELLARLERLQAQPMAEEKSQFERSSVYLVEQINSLKRELYKAKAVVENYKTDRESERQESLHRNQRRRGSFPDTEELHQRRHSPENSPPNREERLNMSLQDERHDRPDRQRRFETPNRREEEALSRRHDRGARESKERGNSYDQIDHGRQGATQRGLRIERRHEPRLSQGQIEPQFVGTLNKDNKPIDPFDNPPQSLEVQVRRDPNRGHGNIIATEYPDERKKGKKEELHAGRFSSGQKSKLQAEIGSFYCKRG